MIQKTSLSKVLLPALTAGLFTVSAHGDTLGVYTGVGYWSPSFSGGFQSENSALGKISLKEDLGYGSGSASNFYLAFEHPLPLIPEIRLERTNLSESSRDTLTRTIEFEGTTYTAGSEVSSEFDLSHTDVTAYYELLDDTLAASLDLGLTVRLFDGEVRVEGEKVTLDTPVPMLYGSGNVRIPGTDIAFGGTIQYLNIGDASMADYRAFARYESPYLLAGEVGYRVFDLDLDGVDSLKADFKAEGAYASVYLHF